MRVITAATVAIIVTLLIISHLLAPTPAKAGVNAASIVRAKCKRTPPELRSPKCIRLVGTN